MKKSDIAVIGGVATLLYFLLSEKARSRAASVTSKIIDFISLRDSSFSDIMPRAEKEKLNVYSYYLRKFLPQYNINTPIRVAAFMAQIAHETGELFFIKEKWGPSKWQLKYEGAKDKGNIYPGDGKKFLGRGLMQLTGRENYENFGKDVYGDKSTFTANPELLEQPFFSVLSAVWYWNKRKLNQLADTGNFKLLTQRINGKQALGYQQRYNYYKRALSVLNAGQSLVLN